VIWGNKTYFLFRQSKIYAQIRNLSTFDRDPIKILSPRLSAYKTVKYKYHNPKKVGVNFEERTYSDTCRNT